MIDNAPGNTIGGPGAGQGNLISGFASGSGIEITFAQSDNNVVRGNRVVTNLAGNAAIPNLYGIRTHEGADGTQIGGTAGAGNVVSGNASNGIELRTSNNVVQGNVIGLAADGATDLGNAETASGSTAESGRSPARPGT